MIVIHSTFLLIFGFLNFIQKASRVLPTDVFDSCLRIVATTPKSSTFCHCSLYLPRRVLFWYSVYQRKKYTSIIFVSVSGLFFFFFSRNYIYLYLFILSDVVLIELLLTKSIPSICKFLAQVHFSRF